ncbi:MAG: tight adherence protein, partial [Gaiellaceae bacterium]|nr:tight adherence protein [Gaiellaceae bacterium]
TQRARRRLPDRRRGCRLQLRAARRARTRLEAHVAPAEHGAKRRRAASRLSLTTRIVRTTDRALRNVRQFRSLQQLLERADVPLRAAEFVYIQLGCAFLFAMLFLVAGAPSLVTLGALVAGGAVPRFFLGFRARKRLQSFENQLPDLLITLAASLKAGHSFRQGIQSVVEEGAEPAAKEFKRVMTETQLGKPIDDALAHMAKRVGSPNFTFVINAVTIQRQIGGSLAGLFDMVAETVRQRQQFGRKVKSLTAMGRMSAYVLVGLPFFIATIVTLLNPTYMAPLYHTGLGQELMIGSVIMIGIGSLMLKRIATFRG